MATSVGIAKPMPTLPPDGEKIAVLMPTTCPSVLKVGPARVAAVDRGVDLQEVVVGASADIAAAGRNDAGRDRAAEAERVADRDHPIADARHRSPPLHIGIVRAVLELQQSEIGLLVGADDGRRNGAAVLHRDLHVGRVLDHVVIGHDVAVRRDQEAGALGHADAGMVVRHGTAAVLLLLELVEEALQRIALRNVGHRRGLLRIVVRRVVDHLDLDRNDGRGDAIDDIGERAGCDLRRRGLTRDLGGVSRIARHQARGDESAAERGDGHCTEKRGTDGRALGHVRTPRDRAAQRLAVSMRRKWMRAPYVAMSAG